MSDKKEMVEWLRKIKEYQFYWTFKDMEMIDSILAALEESAEEVHVTFHDGAKVATALDEPSLNKSWMKLAEDLNVPFSAVKIIRDKIELDMEGPSEKERIELLSFFNGLIKGCLANKGLKDESACDSPCREYIQRIRLLIQGNPAPGKEEKGE